MSTWICAVKVRNVKGKWSNVAYKRVKLSDDPAMRMQQQILVEWTALVEWLSFSWTEANHG